MTITTSLSWKNERRDGHDKIENLKEKILRSLRSRATGASHKQII
jgi:hypothetical protein